MKTVALWIIALCLLAIAGGGAFVLFGARAASTASVSASRVAFDAKSPRVEADVLVANVRRALVLIDRARDQSPIEVPAMRVDLASIAEAVQFADMPPCLSLARIKTVNAIRNMGPVLDVLSARTPAYLSAEEAQQTRGSATDQAMLAVTSGLASVKAELATACAS